MKNTLVTGIGMVGSGLAYLLGGWDSALETLIICMAIDYITGLICAGVFHKSSKTENGSLESRAGWKGLVKKGITLMIVIIGQRLDILFEMDYIRTAICIGFIANEFISIIENCGLMGIPLPKAVINALELLKEKEGDTHGN